MKNMLSVVSLLFVFLSACGTEPAAEPDDNGYPDPDIVTFSVEAWPDATVEIDAEDNSVNVVLPKNAVPGISEVEFTLTEHATANPESGTEMDLSEAQAIYLSTPDGNAAKYTVMTTVEPSDKCELTSIFNDEHYVEGFISGSVISFKLPYGSEVTSLTFDYELSDGATIRPDLSKPTDVSEPVEVTVTAADGVTHKNYTLTVEVEQQETAVRGVYLPSPSHTTSFSTLRNVQESLDLMAELNFNCLFVCVWAGSQAAWNSEVLLANSTWPSTESGNMYSHYTGGSGDALKDIISEAHQRGIKVILWFEYGFMHGMGGVNTSDPILSKHPDWIGIGNDGGYSNYNNNDYYLNAYDPEVREFMLSLMEEAVEKYPDVDGIQGDDRLPAMPRNSGYDEKTIAEYREQTGNEPPQNYDDVAWVSWRLDILNDFAVTMYERLKAKKDDIIVCFAPNKYPWCESVLMQDWPQWIADGAVDLLTVQFYVTATYQTDVQTALNYVRENTDRNLLNPAMILKNGDAILSENVLVNELQFNRSVGTCGESQFWFDGLKTDYVQEVFRKFYAAPAKFPDWL